MKNLQALAFLLHTISLIFFRVNAEEELLNFNNFDQIISEYKVVIVNFYADWCHFCRQLAPIYHDAALKVEDLKLNKEGLFAKVDCIADAKLGEKFAVTKYPTLKIFREGYLQKSEYRGARTVDDLTEFLKKQLEDPYQLLVKTSEDFNMISTDYHHTHVLGVFTSNSSKNSEFKMFKRVASALYGTCKFFAIIGFTEDKEGVYFRAHNNWDDVQKPIIPLSLSSMEDNLAIQTVKNKCRSKVRELTFDNAEEITEEGLPLFILFHNKEDNKAKLDFTNHIIKNFMTEDSVTFVTADGAVFSHPLAHLNLKLENLPAVVIDSMTHMYTFKEKLSDAYNNSQLFQDFIKNLHSGVLHMQFHYPEMANTIPQDNTQTNTPQRPPESVFSKLQPNRNRYSMSHDEF